MRIKGIVILLVVVCLAAAAQAQEKLLGTATCGKPDVHHAVDIGDRANHSYALDQLKCTWSKAMEMAGGPVAKEYDVWASSEISGNTSRDRGYVAGSLENGDKYYLRYQGVTALRDGVPQAAEGTWTYTGGTGKLKGLKGSGTFKGRPGADGNLVYEVEGDYEVAPPPPPSKKAPAKKG